MEGGCTAPIGALATFEGKNIHFSGGVFSLQGSQAKTVETIIPIGEAKNRGIELAQELLLNGGKELMKEFKSKHE